VPYKNIEQKKEWNARNRDKNRAYRQKHRAKVAGITLEAIEARRAERERKRVESELNQIEEDRIILLEMERQRRERALEQAEKKKRCTRCGKVKHHEFIHRYSYLGIWRLCNDCRSARLREYKKRHPETEKRWRRKAYERIKSNPDLRVRQSIRQRISKAIAAGGKGERVSPGKLRYLGCSCGDAVGYLEQQFKPGMTWENYGKVWHIDHIFPIACYDMRSESDRCKAFHYTNLQPMFAKENMRKGARIPCKGHQLMFMPT